MPVSIARFDHTNLYSTQAVYYPTAWSTSGNISVTMAWTVDATGGAYTSDFQWQPQPVIATSLDGVTWAPLDYTVPPVTQEEADRRLAAAQAELHKSAVRRQKAVKRGRRLLMSLLTEAQQREYARSKTFTVMGADGKVYRLRKGGTTHELDVNGKPHLSHCIHLPYSYIAEDTLVAVKLMLETDPLEFRRIANTSKLCIAA